MSTIEEFVTLTYDIDELPRPIVENVALNVFEALSLGCITIIEPVLSVID